MVKFFALLFMSLAFAFTLRAQDTLHFEIKTALFKLGDLEVTRTISANKKGETYKLSSSFKVFTFYQIDYLMEAVFDNGLLTRSLTYINVNQKVHHRCETLKTASGYVVNTYNKPSKTIKKSITTSITPLYFSNYSGPDSIFTEFSGSYRPFIHKNDSTYILDPEEPMEFIFRNQRIDRVIVPNAVLNFYIERKP